MKSFSVKRVFKLIFASGSLMALGLFGYQWWFTRQILCAPIPAEYGAVKISDDINNLIYCFRIPGSLVGNEQAYTAHVQAEFKKNNPAPTPYRAAEQTKVFEIATRLKNLCEMDFRNSTAIDATAQEFNANFQRDTELSNYRAAQELAEVAFLNCLEKSLLADDAQLFNQYIKIYTQLTSSDWRLIELVKKAKTAEQLGFVLSTLDVLKYADGNLPEPNPLTYEFRLWTEGRAYADQIKKNTYPTIYNSIVECEKNESTDFSRQSTRVIAATVEETAPRWDGLTPSKWIRFKIEKNLIGSDLDTNIELNWPIAFMQQTLSHGSLFEDSSSQEPYFRKTPEVGDRLILPLKRQSEAPWAISFSDCVLYENENTQKEIISYFKETKNSPFTKDSCNVDLENAHWLSIKHKTDRQRTPYIQSKLIEITTANNKSLQFDEKNSWSNLINLDIRTSYTLGNIDCKNSTLTVHQEILEPDETRPSDFIVNPNKVDVQTQLVDLLTGEIFQLNIPSWSSDGKYLFAGRLSGFTSGIAGGDGGIEQNHSQIFYCNEGPIGRSCESIWTDTIFRKEILNIQWPSPNQLEFTSLDFQYSESAESELGYKLLPSRKIKTTCILSKGKSAQCKDKFLE